MTRVAAEGLAESPGPGPAAAAEPHVPDAYDPRSEAFRADPFAVYELLRREAPVFWSDRMDGWIVARYEDVVAVLMDTKRYTARGSIGIEPKKSDVFTWKETTNVSRMVWLPFFLAVFGIIGLGTGVWVVRRR